MTLLLSSIKDTMHHSGDYFTIRNLCDPVAVQYFGDTVNGNYSGNAATIQYLGQAITIHIGGNRNYTPRPDWLTLFLPLPGSRDIFSVRSSGGKVEGGLGLLRSRRSLDYAHCVWSGGR